MSKPCKKCKGNDRNKYGQCIPCTSAYQKQWRDAKRRQVELNQSMGEAKAALATFSYTPAKKLVLMPILVVLVESILIVIGLAVLLWVCVLLWGAA